MNKLSKIMTVGVGLTAVLSALAGLLYNFVSLAAVSSGAVNNFIEEEGLTHFHAAFYSMSFICIACYIVLAFCGVDLLFVRFRRALLLTEVLIFEVLYSFAICGFWRDPTIGMSVGAATGVSNGGMMFQFLILFPLWAPLVLWWAKQTLEPKQCAA